MAGATQAASSAEDAGSSANKLQAASSAQDAAGATDATRATGVAASADDAQAPSATTLKSGATPASATADEADDGDLATTAASTSQAAMTGEAASSSESASRTHEGVITNSDDNPVRVESLTWWMNGSYVQYAMQVTNTSESTTVQLPSTSVTGRDASGGVVFTRTSGCMVLFPGQSAWLCDLANVGTTALASVEASPEQPLSGSMSPASGALEFEVTSLNEVPGVGNYLKFAGEVACTRDDADVTCDQVRVSVILRDEAGNVVEGWDTYVSRPAKGESVAFEVSHIADVPYATVEAHAQAW